MPKSYTADEVRELLDMACRNAGGRSAWAKKAGCSPQYISDILTGYREPGPTISKNLGLIKNPPTWAIDFLHNYDELKSAAEKKGNYIF